MHNKLSNKLTDEYCILHLRHSINAKRVASEYLYKIIIKKIIFLVKSLIIHIYCKHCFVLAQVY